MKTFKYIKKNEQLKRSMFFASSLSFLLLGLFINYLEMGGIISNVKYIFFVIGGVGVLTEFIRNDKLTFHFIPFYEDVYFSKTDKSKINTHLKMGVCFLLLGQIVRFSGFYELVLPGIILSIEGVVSLVFTFSYMILRVRMKRIKVRLVNFLLRAHYFFLLITVIGFFSLLQRFSFDSLLIIGLLGTMLSYFLIIPSVLHAEFQDKKEFTEQCIRTFLTSLGYVFLFLVSLKAMIYNPFKEVFPFQSNYIYNPIVDLKCMVILLVIPCIFWVRIFWREKISV